MHCCRHGRGNGQLAFTVKNFYAQRSIFPLFMAIKIYLKPLFSSMCADLLCD
jgi:hypothetical protein